jgi:RIP metalloprotease RseP
MNPLQPPPEEDRGRTYADKPTWQRMLVVGCGPLTHFVLAILILGAVMVFYGTPNYGAHPVIDRVSPTLVNGAQSPAAAAGLQAGDAVVAVNGKPVDTADDLVPVLRANAGTPVHIVYVRDGVRHETTVTPELATLGGKKVALIGIDIPRTLGYNRTNPFTGLVQGTRLTFDISTAVIARMGQVFGPAGIHRIIELLGGAPRQTTDVGTVVGTARLAGQAAASRDWADLLVLFATVNIFVGILNLLPVPPFDGGHVAVALWEKVTRRRVDARRLIPVAAVVMGFLVLFSLSVLYLDLVNPIPNPFR